MVSVKQSIKSEVLRQLVLKIEDISTDDGDLEDVFVQLTKH